MENNLWFKVRSLKVNSGKFQFMTLVKKTREKYSLNIVSSIIIMKESDKVEVSTKTNF